MGSGIEDPFAETEAKMIRVLGIGAEATIYLVKLREMPMVVKMRVPKPYRNPVIDRDVRTRRTLTEVRTMTRAHDLGVKVPHVLHVDLLNSAIYMEYVEGKELRYLLHGDPDESISYAGTLGDYLGRIHEAGMYHGDPVPSNVIVSERDLYLIDFGLSGYSNDVEEHAIDLNLVERSLESSFPSSSRRFIDEVWSAYEGVRGPERAEEVKRRVQEIRKRARYVVRGAL